LATKVLAADGLAADGLAADGLAADGLAPDVLPPDAQLAPTTPDDISQKSALSQCKQYIL